VDNVNGNVSAVHYDPKDRRNAACNRHCADLIAETELNWAKHKLANSE